MPFVFKSLLTASSNILHLHLKQTFPPIIWIFTDGEGDGIESRLHVKIFSTLTVLTKLLDLIIHYFLLHFLKEKEDKPAEDEVLKTLVYSLDFRCALLLSVFVFGHVFFWIPYMKRLFNRECLFLWAFAVALVRRMTSAEFAFLFMVSNPYVL